MLYLFYNSVIGTLCADPLIVSLTNNSQEPYEYVYQTPQEERIITPGEECTYNNEGKKITFPRNERTAFEKNQIESLRKWHRGGEKGERPHILQLRCKPAQVTKKITSFTGSVGPNASLAINHDITKGELSLTPLTLLSDPTKKIPLLKVAMVPGAYLVTKEFLHEFPGTNTIPFHFEPNGRYRLIINADFSVTIEKIP